MLVTGASWRVAIGAAIARRLVADGAWVMLQSWSPHDQEQSWARDPGGPDALVAELRAVGGREADVRLFTTLMQFDALYQATSRAIGRNWPRCRCSGRTRANFSRPRLRRHHRLRPHQAALLLVHRDINPTGIVPVGPDRRVDKPARPGGARRAAVRRRNATAASPARGDDPARAHPARRLARLQPPLVLEDQVERRGE